MARQNKQASRPAASKGAGKNTQKKAAPRKAAQPQPKPRKAAPVADTAPGAVAWKLALILCCGLIIISLLFASVNGGSQYIGMPDSTPKATATPPVVTPDPNVNISGSQLTPIPADPSPEVSPEVTPDAEAQQSPAP